MDARRLLIKAGRVLTMNSRRDVHRNAGVLIEDGVIRSVGAWAEFGSAADEPFIDASEFTVMPGLIDAHTHVVHDGSADEDWTHGALTESAAFAALRAANNARRHLARGVTAIRDLGSRDYVDVAVRDAVRSGRNPGPRMMVAGKGITATGGHMDGRRGLRPDVAFDGSAGMGLVVDSPTEARRAARHMLMVGSDVVKINATLSEHVRALGGQCSPELSAASMRAVCEVAHEAGRKVAAHCHGGSGTEAAIVAGVDTLEHGRFLTTDMLEVMSRRGTFLVPTLSPEARRVERGDPPQEPAVREWYRRATEVMYDTVLAAHDHGVRVVAGSDAGMPHVKHGEVAYEIVQLTHAGLPTIAALAAATSQAADAIGLGDRIGTVRDGHLADLLVVRGDPSADASILLDRDAIALVMQEGTAIRLPAFDDLQHAMPPASRQPGREGVIDLRR